MDNCGIHHIREGVSMIRCIGSPYTTLLHPLKGGIFQSNNYDLNDSGMDCLDTHHLLHFPFLVTLNMIPLSSALSFHPHFRPPLGHHTKVCLVLAVH